MCDNPAKYRFTWPGRDESLICEEHVVKLESVANAMGFNILIIPLSEQDLELGLTCSQESD